MFHVVPMKYLKEFPSHFDFLFEATKIKQEEGIFLRFLSKMKKVNTQWILDMGTGIGEAASLADYKQMVGLYMPSFFVVPDKLGDMKATLKLFEESLDWAWKFSSMPICVAQGQDFSELCKCIELYTRLSKGNYRVGIPYRVFQGSNTLERAFDRIRTVNSIIKLFPNVQFHLLGMWHPIELYLLAFPNIKSCDSSFGYLMSAEGLPLYAIRPNDASLNKKYLEVPMAELIIACTWLDYVTDTFMHDDTYIEKMLVEGGDKE